MSKEAWFREYERLEAEYPEESDEMLDKMARDCVADDMAARADQLADEAKES